MRTLNKKVTAFPRRAKHVRHGRWKAAIVGLDARIAHIERRIAELDRRAAQVTIGERMRTALIASMVLHALVLFGVTFTMPAKMRVEDRVPQLEVVLVNAKSRTQPVKADALAQHNLDGGGNTDEQRRAQSPLPVLADQKPEADVKLALRRVEQLEREARQLMTIAKAPARVESAPASPKAAPQADAEPKAEPQTSDIMQRSLEIARLEAKISRDWESYQQRPRRRFIGARTQEFRFARYVEDWRQKIERVGEINYPQAARDQKLSGHLVVTVSIKSDGTVEHIGVDRGSGHKILDDAARRIVQLASPFAAFPADIAKDTDIISITRTWTFTSADRFVSE